MRTRTLITLAVLTAGMVAAAGWSVAVRTQSVAAGMAEGPLFPGLAARVNDVTRLDVAGYGGHATVARGADGTWIVEQKDGYRADANAVKALVVALAEARVLEPRTALPDLYGRIGVEDPETPGAASSSVTLTGSDGARLAALIVGKPAAPAASTLYARKVGEAPSWLVKADLGAVETDPMRWIDQTMPRVPGDAVASVEIRQPDGRVVGIRREAPGQPFTASGLQDDATAAPAVIDQTAEAAALLTPQDVARADPALFRDAVTTLIRRFDGGGLTVRTVRRDGQFWVTFDAAGYGGWQYRVSDAAGRALTRSPEEFAAERGQE